MFEFTGKGSGKKADIGKPTQMSLPSSSILAENKRISNEIQPVNDKATRNKRKSEETSVQPENEKSRKTTRLSKENDGLPNENVKSTRPSRSKKSMQNEQDIANTPYGRRKGLKAMIANAATNAQMDQPSTSGIVTKKAKTSSKGKQPKVVLVNEIGLSPKRDKDAGDVKMPNSGSSAFRTPSSSGRNVRSRTSVS